MQSASCSFVQGTHSHSIAARGPVARPHDLCGIAQCCNKMVESQVVGPNVAKNNETEAIFRTGGSGCFERLALQQSIGPELSRGRFSS